MLVTFEEAETITHPSRIRVVLWGSKYLPIYIAWAEKISKRASAITALESQDPIVSSLRPSGTP